MPRAHRHHLAHLVWHLTHRCHRRQFLLKFARDRRVWARWLYEARKRYGLCVLDYAVTSNHVHLVVRDQGRGEIAPSMQLIAGRSAQAYNDRKQRRGAFWEDRYHATAVETGEHLARCIVYIDFNMVRAGVVAHPADWEVGGYHEIQSPRRRYRIVDRAALAEASGVARASVAAAHAEWIAAELRDRSHARAPEWSESLAVGSQEYVESVAGALGCRARHRHVEVYGDFRVLREPSAAYGRGLRTIIAPLRPEWDGHRKGNT